MKLLPGISIRIAPFAGIKRRIARATGIPTTRTGRHAKLGRLILKGWRR